MIRVLLADKPSLTQFGIRSIISTEKDLRLIGEATDSYKAQQLSAKLVPDVLLLDLDSPDFEALEVLSYLG